MSEYWKSTPKYWCKFCSVFVRDTKFEKQKHEATGRHQGGIQKSLRDLHRGKEQELREKDRAKSEIARLTGAVTGRYGEASGSAAAESSVAGGVKAPTREVKKVATAEDRKRQMAQLAAMGIEIPGEFRQEVAMKGEWQTVAVHPIGGQEKKDFKDEKLHPDAIAKGIRKRKVDEIQEEDFDEVKPRKAWGTGTKSYPGKADDIDLDDLLNEPITLKQDEVKIKSEASPKPSSLDEVKDMMSTKAEIDNTDEIKSKLEHSEDATEAPAGIVFKKRKAKAIRTT